MVNNDEIDTDDLNRVHDRIDGVIERRRDHTQEYIDILRNIETELTALNERVKQNDEKTDKLTNAVKKLVKENKDRKHDLEMHKEKCPARSIALTAASLLGASGIGAVAIKIIEWVLF